MDWFLDEDDERRKASDKTRDLLLRGRRGARRASRQGRQHPRHAGVALAAHRALRRAVRRRGRAHRREDRLRAHAVRRRTCDTLDAVLEVVGGAARRNGGIAIDTWHMSKLGIAPDDLRRIPLEYLSLDRAVRRAVRRHGRPDRRGRSTTATSPARASSTSRLRRGLRRITATPGRGASRRSPRSCATTRSTSSSGGRTRRPPPNSDTRGAPREHTGRKDLDRDRLVWMYHADAADSRVRGAGQAHVRRASRA